MANQNFRIKNGLEVGGVEVVNSSGSVNTSSFPASGVNAGTVGNTTTIPVITVDAKGLVTNIQSASVSGVSNYTYTSSNSTFVLSTGDGSNFAQTIPTANSSTLGLIKVGSLLTVNATGFINLDEGNIDHDQLTGFVSNEHIDHSTVSVTAGNGLSGGGDITATRTIAVVAGNTQVISNSSGVFIDESEIDIHNLSGYVANEHIDHSTVSVTAGDGLSGGGDITTNRSFAVVGNTALVSNSSGVHVAAGDGLTANSTDLKVTAGTGVTVNATGVHIGQDVSTTANVTFSDVIVSGNLTINGTQTTIDTNNLVVNDAIITVASGQTGVPALDAGIEVERGDSANALLIWDESQDRWIQKLAGGTEYVLHTKQHDIALGTDTSGNYIDDISAGNGIAVTHTPGEGSDPSIAVVANTGITANSSGVFSDDSAIVHDNLSGFVSNEHIDHSSVTLTAGNGLSGGGDITTNRSFAVGAGNGISVNSTAVAVAAGNNQVVSNSTGVFINEGNIDIHNLSGYVANENIDHSGVTLTAGNGLTGGGDITTNRSFAVGAGNGISVNSTAVAVSAGSGIASNATGVHVVAGNNQVVSNSTGVFINESNIDIHNLSGYVANENIDHSSVNLTAGNGLTGGGTIAASRSFAVNAGDGVVVNATGVHVAAGNGLDVNSTSLSINDSTIRGLFSAGGDLSYNSSTGQFSFTNDAGDIESVTAGNGLTGGGTTGALTLTVGAGNGISVNSTAVAVSAGSGIASNATGVHVVAGNNQVVSNSTGIFVNESNLDIHNLSGYVANENIDHSSVSISAGNGLSGGGDITASRSLAVAAGNTQVISNSSGVFIDESEIDIHNLSGYVANENIDHSTVSVTAGNGLTGGGTIASTRTLTVGAGDGIVTNATAVSVGAGNGLSVNSSAVAVKANNGITSNSTGTFVKAGTGVTVNATGVHIGQSVGTTDDVTFNDVNVSGNLTISGTQTTVSTATLSVTDAIITVAKDQTGTPSVDAGLEVERGDSANALFFWDESADRWTHKLAGGTEYAFHTKANDIALGTDTSGNYVDNVTGGNGIAVTGSAGEGWEPAVAVVANTGITANSSGVFTNDSEIVHDNLSGFVANEHIDHSTVSVTAGNGLTGGGTIAATRTLAVGAGNGISVNSTAVAVAAGNNQVVSNSSGVFIAESNIDIHNLSGYVANENIDHSSVTLTAGNGLSGGGDITTNRSFAVLAGTGVVTNSTGVHANSAYIRGLISAGGDLSYDSGTGVISFTNDAGDIEGVTAGNGLTGGGTTGTVTVTVGAGNGISVNSTAVAVKANTGITANSTGVFTNDSQIVHDNLSGFVSNEHIDHSSVSITAGNGLSGGGTIAATRTINVVGNTGIVANSTGVFTNDSQIVHDSLSGFVANEHINHSSVTLTAGNGLTGGGDITTNRSFAVAAGNNQVVSNSTGVFINESNIDIHNLSGYVAGEHIDHATVSITAGNGLTGGGDISSTRSLAVVAGNTQLISNASGIFANQANFNHNALSNYVSNQHIDHSSVSITAGNGLSGGGTIAATRTLAVVGNTGITANSTGVFTNDSQIVHDNLSGFVSNEHIDHSTVSVTAGNGLTGGGTIAATRTLAVGAGNGISVNSTAVAVSAGNGIASNATGVHVVGGTGVTSNSTGVHIGQSVGTSDNVTFADVTISGNLTVSGTQTTLNTTELTVNDSIITLLSGHSGAPALDSGLEINRGSSANALIYWDESTDRWTHKLSGGTEYVFHTKANDIVLGTDTSGNYIDNVTAGNGISVTHTPGEGSEPSIAVKANTGIIANSSGIFADASNINHDNLSGFVANEHINHSSVSITAGNGLTGGGNITATRTLSVVGGTGVTSNSTGVHIGQSVGTSDSVTFASMTASANAIIANLYDSSNRVLKVYNDTGTVVWG